MLAFVIANIHMKVILNTQLDGRKESLINNQLMWNRKLSIRSWQEILSMGTVEKTGEVLDSLDPRNKQHISILAVISLGIRELHHPLFLEEYLPNGTGGPITGPNLMVRKPSRKINLPAAAGPFGPHKVKVENHAQTQ